MASDMNKHHEEKRSIELGITFLYELLTTKSDDYQEHLFVRLIDALGFKMPAAKSEKGVRTFVFKTKLICISNVILSHNQDLVISSGK